MDVVSAYAYAYERLGLLKREMIDISTRPPWRDTVASLAAQGDRASFESSPHGILAKSYAERCGQAVLSLRLLPGFSPEFGEMLKPWQDNRGLAWLAVCRIVAESTPCYPHPVRKTAAGYELPGFLRQSAEVVGIVQQFVQDYAAANEAPPATTEPRVASQGAPAETTPAQPAAGKEDCTKLIDEYLVRCNREAPQDADTFLVAKGKRQVTMLIEAGMLPRDLDDSERDRIGGRLDTASGKHPLCIAASKKAKADAADIAQPDQGGDLYDNGASKRKLPRNRLPKEEGAYDPKLCEHCNTLPRGCGMDGKFCSLHSKELSPREQKAIASGERRGEWEGLPPHRLHEQRLKAAALAGQ